MSEPTYSERAKRELCEKIWPLAEAQSLLRAFLLNAASVKAEDGQTYWEVRTGFPFVADFVLRRLTALYDVKPFTPAVTRRPGASRRRVWHVRFVGNFAFIESDLRLSAAPDPAAMDEPEARAFLAGAFLAGGSVSSPQGGNYHLELHAQNRAYLEIVGAILERQNVIWKAKIIPRRGRYVLYVKRAEAISDALRLMHAPDAMFRLEELRINRDLDNNLRRINNLDVSNLDRAAKKGAADAMVALELLSSPGFAGLPKKLRAYCGVRAKESAATLADVAEAMARELGKPVSRATVWRLSRDAKKAHGELRRDPAAKKGLKPV